MIISGYMRVVSKRFKCAGMLRVRMAWHRGHRDKVKEMGRLGVHGLIWVVCR